MGETEESMGAVVWRQVAPPLLGVAAIWSAFSVALSFAGHQPSGPSPFPAESHYAFQAALLPVAFVFAFFGASKVIRTALRAVAIDVDTIRRATTWSAYAVSGSLLFAFLLPDLVVYFTQGFSGLGPLLKVTAPVVFLSTVVTVAATLKRIADVSVARAGISAVLFAGFFFFLLSLVVR